MEELCAIFDYFTKGNTTQHLPICSWSSHNSQDLFATFPYFTYVHISRCFASIMSHKKCPHLSEQRMLRSCEYGSHLCICMYMLRGISFPTISTNTLFTYTHYYSQIWLVYVYCTCNCLQYAPLLSTDLCTMTHVLKFHFMDICPPKKINRWS